MGGRRGQWILLALSLLSLGAQFRTTNFVVNAPNAQIAQQVGQWAEHYRKEKAVLWLGQEMPAWSQPCPLDVQVTMDGPSGATSFNFGQGRILGMHMQIKGPLDRLIASVLPHEITHTVFAQHFRCPVPRWADEGGSVLSEDDAERDRHDALVRQILNQGKQIPLRRLLALKEYPREVMCLYAQGFSLSDYLVGRSDRRTFLAFVGHGMQMGWDHAAQTYYGQRSVEDLEETWLKHLRDTRRTPEMQLAQNQRKTQPTASGRTVRLTVPPAQPLDPPPVVRGLMPNHEQTGHRFGDLPVTPPVQVPYPIPPAGPGQGWQAVSPLPSSVQGQAQLGTPQSYPAAAVPFPQ